MRRKHSIEIQLIPADKQRRGDIWGWEIQKQMYILETKGKSKSDKTVISNGKKKTETYEGGKREDDVERKRESESTFGGSHILFSIAYSVTYVPGKFPF